MLDTGLLVHECLLTTNKKIRYSDEFKDYFTPLVAAGATLAEMQKIITSWMKNRPDHVQVLSSDPPPQGTLN